MLKHSRRINKHSKNIWQIQEAKARFSELIQDATQRGYQTITKNGQPIAVMISKEEFDKMNQPALSLLDFFRSAPCQEIEMHIQRSKDLPRKVDL